MPQLRDFIGRFRPVGVPADREAELAAELGPVLALLQPTEADCGRVVALARETAEKISAEARGRVSEIEAAASRRARTTREQEVEQALASTRDEARHALDEAATAAGQRREPERWRVEELIDEALSMILALPQASSGPPEAGQR